VHPGRSARTLKNAFYQTHHLRVFLVFNGRTVRALSPDGPRLVVDDARFSFGQSVVLSHVFALFLSEAHPGVTDGPPQGSGRSVYRCFSKMLLLSGIIYGIPDS
jgi:hypothetical protein